MSNKISETLKTPYWMRPGAFGRFAATNKGTAFVAMSPDPFELKKSLKSFKFTYGSRGSGGTDGKFLVEMSIVIPSIAIEKKIMDHLLNDDGDFTIWFGWEGDQGTSEKLKCHLVRANYNLSLGQEIVMDLHFAVGGSDLSEHSKVTNWKGSSAEAKIGFSTGVDLTAFRDTAAAIETLVESAFSMEGISCVLNHNGLKANIEAAIGAYKRSIKSGHKDQKNGGSSGKWKKYIPQTWSDAEIDNMSDDYAKLLANITFLEESPFFEYVPPVDGSFDPDDPIGQLYSNFNREKSGDKGEERDKSGSVGDSPGIQQLGSISTPEDFVEELLGASKEPRNVPAVADNVFSPEIEGPSEYLQQITEARDLLFKTVTLPNWEDQYSGRYEYWAGGTKQIIINESTSDLRTWDRDDSGRWNHSAPTLRYAERNLTLVGEGGGDGWSDSMFEVPPQDDGAAFEQYGPGVWFFRLTNDSVVRVIQNTTALDARVGQINTLNTLEFMPPPPTAAMTEPYSTPEFVFTSDPFSANDIAFMTSEDGGGGETELRGDWGGGPEGDFSFKKDKPGLLMSIKPGQSVEDALNDFINWGNEIIGEQGHPLAYRISSAEFLHENGKAKENVFGPVPKTDKVVYICEERELDISLAAPPSKHLKPIKSFPWIAQGVNLKLDVGGWSSIVASFKAEADSLGAIASGRVGDSDKTRSVDDAEANRMEPVLNEKLFKFEDAVKGIERNYPGWAPQNLTKWLLGSVFGLKASEIAMLEKTNPSSFSRAPKTAEVRGLKKNKFVHSKKLEKAVLDWGKVFLEPKITTLGIPEICRYDEIGREVTLSMPDMRGTGMRGIGSNHAFDGKYKIVSYTHTISPGVGFKTELKLIPFEMSAPWGGEQAQTHVATPVLFEALKSGFGDLFNQINPFGGSSEGGPRQ